MLVTAHDAFGYFGRRYGFEVRGLQGISTATEAGAQDVQQLAEFIADQRIPSLFVESSVSPRAIAAVRARCAAAVSTSRSASSSSRTPWATPTRRRERIPG